MMDSHKNNKISELKDKIEQLEEKMSRYASINTRAYNNLKNEQWKLINELRKIEKSVDDTNILERE